VSAAVVEPGGEKTVVLVVDDEPAIRLLCRVNLELDGYEVREAATLKEAREALAAGGIAVVLLDMHVGLERSEELLGELRESGQRVVVVTGSTDLDAEWSNDADAVLAKPFAIDHLLQAVRSLAAPR
jgi:DNA-binding NtrC family response regulator